MGFPGITSGKESTCQCRRHKRRRFDPWLGKIPWRRKWQPPPVFLPGKFSGQRSLVSCSPRSYKESDTTEHNTQNKILFKENTLAWKDLHPWNVSIPDIPAFVWDAYRGFLTEYRISQQKGGKWIEHRFGNYFRESDLMNWEYWMPL